METRLILPSRLILLKRNKMKNAKGTITLEYVIIITVVVAALVGMSIYMKRAICGKWREAADAIGFGKQYDPQKTIQVK